MFPDLEVGQFSHFSGLGHPHIQWTLLFPIYQYLLPWKHDFVSPLLSSLNAPDSAPKWTCSSRGALRVVVCHWRVGWGWMQ